MHINRKKNYIKPEIKCVQLKPEEAVLKACKNDSVSGPHSSGCLIPMCFTQGS